MANRKNLRPKDVDEELEKLSGPRDVGNPMSQKLRKSNPGEVRAKKELEERAKTEYPGTEE